MNSSEIAQRIISEDREFVLSEHKKLRTLYALKKEIRYERIRNTEFDTESVAEHIYVMHCLCDYFLPLDERLSNADEASIRTMIQYHDIDEIKTGDIPNYKKSESNDTESQAAVEVIAELPLVMQEKISNALNEYHEQKTLEAKFVKALDKAEPALQCYDEEMKKVLKVNNVSLKKGMAGNKKEYMEVFPVIIHFNNVIANQMLKEGYFAED